MPDNFTGFPVITNIIISLNNIIRDLQPEIISRNLSINLSNIQADIPKYLICIGKNALKYADTILRMYPNYFSRIIVLQAKEYTSIKTSTSDKIEISLLDHPIPSSHNFNVTKNLLEIIEIQEKQSYFHFIISGGTSSCLALPESKISEDEYIQISNELQKENIDIFALNEIRSAIDSVKAGKLAILLDRHQVHTTIISDVFTNDPAYVGSGPTVPGIRLNTRSRNLYQSVISNLKKPIPVDEFDRKLAETSVYTNENHNWHVIASNNNFCEGIKDFLRNSMSEFTIKIVTTKLNEDSKAFAESLSVEFNSLKSSSIFIWAGELVTMVDSPGIYFEQGGRLSLFSYYAAHYLEKFDNFGIIAFATDSKDGSSPQSCYYVNTKTLRALNKTGNYEDLELHKYDMGNIFNKAGYSFETRFTNINFADIIILVKY